MHFHAKRHCLQWPAVSRRAQFNSPRERSDAVAGVNKPAAAPTTDGKAVQSIQLDEVSPIDPAKSEAAAVPTNMVSPAEAPAGDISSSAPEKLAAGEAASSEDDDEGAAASAILSAAEAASASAAEAATSLRPAPAVAAEMAKGLKQKGNAAFGKGLMLEAVEHYSAALQVVGGPSPHGGSDGAMPLTPESETMLASRVSRA